MGRLVLIDGNAILHRAFHAFPITLTTRQGETVNAVYGFTKILLTVISDLHPKYLAVTFDLPAPTFRQKEYIAYHANRPKMDDVLSSQIKRVYEVVEALNLPIFTAVGFEADDVIGTLAKQAGKKRVETVIVTGDRDLLQLVDEKTKVYSPGKGFSEPILYNEDKVIKKMGIKPEQVVDYKALVGDSSDNYPGVPGIGPKTAVKLLLEFGSLKRIYEQLPQIETKLGKKLAEDSEMAFLSQKLAQIVTDAPVKLRLKACLVHDYNHQKAIDLFGNLEFKSLIRKLPNIREEEIKKDHQAALF